MTRPLRIICPTYWYPAHATDTRATFVHDINRHLTRRGHAVRVVTPGGGGLPTRDKFDGVEVVRFSLKVPEDLTSGKVAQTPVRGVNNLKRIAVMGRYFAKQTYATLKEGRAFGAEVVHAHWAIPTGPAAVCAARRLRIPCVITMHGGDVYVNPSQGYDFPTRWYVRPALRWTLRSASALTAITNDCRQHALRAGAPAERIHIILNGADLSRFSPSSNGQPNPPDLRFGPHMIFACRQLFPRKGIRFLIRAAGQLRPRFPDLKVVIAGDGWERGALEQLAAELGLADSTTFLGWVANADLPEYYRASAMSVIPSLEEGFGIPAAEAMGCGVPVVASDAGGLPEVVADGVTGRVVPRGDVDALARAIEELLLDRDLRARMGKAGRERALLRFDWELSAQQFEALYRDLIAGGADRR